MTGARELLEQAIGQAHGERPDPLACIECGCDVVVAAYRPALGGWLPQSLHYASCPVLAGGLAAWQCHNDTWAALERYMLVADYGEQARARELAGT
jgi:hypothetical protein